MDLRHSQLAVEEVDGVSANRRREVEREVLLEEVVVHDSE